MVDISETLIHLRDSSPTNHHQPNHHSLNHNVLKLNNYHVLNPTVNYLFGFYQKETNAERNPPVNIDLLNLQRI